MSLLQSFQQYINQQDLFHPKDKLLLAVSGGMDSVVLAALCKQAGHDFSIAHCNFQLRGEDSNRDEQFVKKLAARYAVPFYSTTFNTALIAETTKRSIEETARNLRYEWFESIRKENELQCILTAHHADDNIETVLMNFFRGTGIRGLHGIQAKQSNLIRPLLFARHEQLELFLEANQLDYVMDHTNLEDAYTRNYFRNQLIPAVQKVFPAAEENILHNIARFNEAEILYKQAIDQHKKKLLEYKGDEVHVPTLKLQKSKPLVTIVYEIIKDFGFTAHQTNEVIHLLQSDTGKYVHSSTHRILKNRKWLIISPLKSETAGITLIEKEEKQVEFAAGKLRIELIAADNFKMETGNDIAQLDAGEIKFPLLLRRWKQGDYFYPLGMKKKKKLSRFFIDQKFSLIDKENTWVLATGQKIVWIAGRRIDDRAKVTGKTKMILKINFTPRTF